MSDTHFWVFGYGSLMWNPGFEYLDQVKAQISGYHRAPCIYSREHRGTRATPGIVLGLDRGGSCVGTAFKIQMDLQEPVMAYLRKRELVTNVYTECQVCAVLESGESIEAVTYVAQAEHEQYAGCLDEPTLLSHIATAIGDSGRNDDYFIDTARKLEALGIEDELLASLASSLIQTRSDVM